MDDKKLISESLGILRQWGVLEEQGAAATAKKEKEKNKKLHVPKPDKTKTKTEQVHGHTTGGIVHIPPKGRHRRFVKESPDVEPVKGVLDKLFDLDGMKDEGGISWSGKGVRDKSGRDVAMALKKAGYEIKTAKEDKKTPSNFKIVATKGGDEYRFYRDRGQGVTMREKTGGLKEKMDRSKDKPDRYENGDKEMKKNSEMRKKNMKRSKE